MPALFEEPFVTSWIFDVEIIARLTRLRQGRADGWPIDVMVESPLLRRTHVSGSKVKPWGFLRALWETTRIYRT
jgi:hypothetical protein